LTAIVEYVHPDRGISSELAWDYFKEFNIEQQSFVYQPLVPQHKIQGSLTLPNTIIFQFRIIYKLQTSDTNFT
jgi:hypothetical protein